MFNFYLFIGYLFGVLTFQNLAKYIDDQNQLLFVQVIWRHGDRAPISTYPNDVHQESSWPYGWGELTEIGMQQQLALGQLLRERYILSDSPLLNERYDPKEIYIHSTDVNRTLISAMSNMAGMYPAGRPGIDYPNESKWPKNWTPVPVHTIPNKKDFVSNIMADCPRADQLHAIIENSNEYRQIEHDYEKFFEYVSKKTGKYYNFSNLYELNNINYIETLYNMSQPNWMTTSVVLKLRTLTRKANEFFYGITKPFVPELIRLRGGNMLKSVVENMQNKINCHPRINRRNPNCKWIRKLKYYAYSAHDTTLAALLTTFGDETSVIPGGLPHYTASLAIELWNTVEFGPAIKIFYHSDFNRDYRLITDLTKGCPTAQQFCPLEVFSKRSQKYMPVDIEEECKAQKENSNEPYEKYRRPSHHYMEKERLKAENKWLKDNKTKKTFTNHEEN